jgi:hypothetical protein
MRESKRLGSIFRALSETRQQALLEYAEFLASKEGAEVAAAPATEPLSIPRPEKENVVRAIQRLMQTYPMLERNRIFHEASAQMTRHLVHGVSSVETIDELERVFTLQYQQHIEALNQKPQSPP